MKSSRSPGDGVHLPAICSSSAALKFLAIGEASLPSASTLNQANPLAAKSSTTNAASSSMPLREYRSAAPLALMPRTRPPDAAVS